MKMKFNWKKFLLFFFVIGAILYITKSFWMTLGIILLLFVIDYLLKEYDERRSQTNTNDRTRKALKSQKKTNTNNTNNTNYLTRKSQKSQKIGHADLADLADDINENVNEKFTRKSEKARKKQFTTDDIDENENSTKT